jgi:phosphonoacetate hydrolase
MIMQPTDPACPAMGPALRRRRKRSSAGIGSPSGHTSSESVLRVWNDGDKPDEPKSRRNPDGFGMSAMRANPAEAGKSRGIERVILVVFDGLRPDLVRADTTPNLHRFRERGACFVQARSLFPSMTRVCASSIATGAPPAVHGIVGNTFFCQEVDPHRPLDLDKIEDFRRFADAGLPALTAPTFADVLATAGKRLAIVHGGTSGATFALAPRAAENGHWVYNTRGPQASLTPEAGHAMRARFGPEPARDRPLFAVIDRIADVFVEHVLATLEPEVALAWLPEPDTSGHFIGLGAPETLAVLRHCDIQFGRILDALEASGRSERSLVIVLSDHGQITVTEEVPLFEDLTRAGFPTATAAEGGAVLLGVRGAFGELRLRTRDERLRDRVVAWLQEHPAIGHLLTRDLDGLAGASPGTLSLRLVGLDHARAPDIAFTLRSGTEPDRYGLRGRGLFMGGVPVNGGMHGGLNPHEMSTVLILGGPGVLPGLRIEAPAGLIDVAPTVLAVLGLELPPTMLGRPLAVAFGAPAQRSDEVVAQAGRQGYHQEIRARRAAGATYLTQGTID